MRVEWINCLTGFRGSVETFPAEFPGIGGAPGIVLRFDGVSVKIFPDFRAGEIRFAGKVATEPFALAFGEPGILQMSGRILAFCAISGNCAGEDWANDYRFPLWTIFEPETFEPIETVRAPAEIPAALKRAGLAPSDCLAAPYGLPAAIPLPQVFDALLTAPVS